MGLDRETELRIRELFGGRRCCQCGQPAARLAGDRFYCPRHFPRGRRRPSKEEKSYRDPGAFSGPHSQSA
jgi:hypothetical protein